MRPNPAFAAVMLLLDSSLPAPAQKGIAEIPSDPAIDFSRPADRSQCLHHRRAADIFHLRRKQGLHLQTKPGVDQRQHRGEHRGRHHARNLAVHLRGGCGYGQFLARGDRGQGHTGRGHRYGHPQRAAIPGYKEIHSAQGGPGTISFTQAVHKDCLRLFPFENPPCLPIPDLVAISADFPQKKPASITKSNF